MAGLIDTHCHIDFEIFDPDRDEVLDRAKNYGVEKFINPGVDLISSQRAIELSEKYTSLYVAVGLHPNSIINNNGFIEDIKHLASNQCVVAIGEIGLDYYREINSKKLQRELFEIQLELATELSLPVIIHNREADGDILKILCSWHNDIKKNNLKIAEFSGVLHSYSSGIDMAYEIIEHNFYIGISGPITYKNASNLRKLVVEIPIEKILLETDSPFLPPHPYRGQRNEPHYLHLIAEKIAQIKNISLEKVALQTSENAEKLFVW